MILDNTPVLRDYSNLAGPSLLKETLGHQNRQSSSFIGASADFDPAMTVLLPFNPKGECLTIQTPAVLRRADQNAHFMMRPDSEEEIEEELNNLDAVEKMVAPHGPALVELYFRIVHPSFPIIHKKVFLEKHGRTYRELTPIGLGAVYILALNWWSYSQTLSSLPKPNVNDLEKLVLRMLFEAHARPKVSDVQGGLVLMQRPDVNSWAMTGHLVSITQNLGLHIDCSDWHIPDWERGVRKRVAWAIFMQDKWGALVYGRPSHIRLDDWDVQPLESSDFPETAKDDDDEEGSAEVEKGKQTFIHMVLLTEIVADLLDEFYSLRALRKSPEISEVLQKAKPLQMRLSTWRSNLPSSLAVDETTARRLSSVGYLHLAYYTAEVTLHRAILRASSFLSIDSDIRMITRTAAGTRFTSALDFAKRLKNEHLQSFWYFSSSVSLALIGTFAGILIATSYDDEERDLYTSRLADYRWTLRISSNGADFMKYAVGNLDASGQLLEQQFGKLALEAQRLSAPSESPADDEVSPSVGDAMISPDAAGWADFDNQAYNIDFEHLAQYDMDGMFSWDQKVI
jgi:Fungal specific transcription factor domain